MPLYHARGLRQRVRLRAQIARHGCLPALLVWATVMAAPPAGEAAPKRAKSHAKAKSSAKAKPKAASRAAKANARAEAEETAGVTGKVAVFAFEGQDTYSVRDHVIQALTDRGLTVETALRPVATAEQFRDMGAALDLAAYVQGGVKELPADHAIATITIRSGVTGRKLTTVTFTGYRRGLPFDVEEKLWQRVGAVFTRACSEAIHATRHHNEPLRIEAGTPL